MQPKIQWDTIETVLLDMDGTLLDLHFDSFFWKQHLPKKYSCVHQVDIDSISTYLHQRLEEKQGSLEWYCTQYWSEQFNLDIMAAQKEICHLISERPQALEFLNHLGDMGKKRVLITNSDRPCLELKFASTRIQQRLDLVISSHDYGVPKEHQQFWVELQQRAPFNPQTTLFIDDSLSVLNSAKTFGIKHILGIKKPDSCEPEISLSQFPTIDQFLSLV
jgi:HAD superfamily hydrolase (TIGR01509 family)